MKEKLIALLKQVPDTYDDFVIGVSLEANRDNLTESIVRFIEANPEANTSEIAEYIDVLKEKH